MPLPWPRRLPKRQGTPPVGVANSAIVQLRACDVGGNKFCLSIAGPAQVLRHFVYAQSETARAPQLRRQCPDVRNAFATAVGGEGR